MKTVVSPAKTMIENTDCYIGSSVPTYIDKSKILLEEIRQRSYEELKEIWKCNEKIAKENFDRFTNMNLQGSLTPAIFSYQGIQYQYMAVNVMEATAIEYIKENLYILSGFFGILRAFDGVSPYRLEMQEKMEIGKHKNLYEFWGDKIYKKLFETGEVVINLASKEYSKLIHSDKLIDFEFWEDSNGKLKQVSTNSKKMRGFTLNYIVKNKISDVKKLRNITLNGYVFDEEMSDERKFVYVKG